MPTVRVRAYEELSEFLPAEKRKLTFTHDLPEGATLLQLLADLGIPWERVDLVLAGGVSVDFSYVIRGGERISVYPVFESFDIAGVTALREEPLRNTRFVADRSLEPLATRLRLLGFDTKLTELPFVDPVAMSRAEAEGRILLTRDLAVARSARMSRVLILKEAGPRAQVQEILCRLNLHRLAAKNRRNSGSSR